MILFFTLGGARDVTMSYMTMSYEYMLYYDINGMTRMASTTAFKYKKLGEAVRGYRGKAELSREALAALLNLSGSFIYHIERGSRRPSREVLVDLCSHLGLTAPESDELLRWAGYVPKQLSKGLTEEADLVRALLADPELGPEDQAELMGELRAFLLRWKRRREIWKKGVRKVVVVLAGWQARLLSAERVEETLLHAASEIQRAGITEMIAIIAPGMPTTMFERLQDRFSLKIKTVVQEKQLGLGHAVLAAADQIAEEPFALLLPDDIDPQGRALRQMIDIYLKYKRPMIAVAPTPVTLNKPTVRYGGVAILGDVVRHRRGLFYLHTLKEKPIETEDLGPNSRFILGRYILSPSIFEALRALSPNSETHQYELTDALMLLLKKQEVLCAYELDRALLPCAPVRALIEKLVDALHSPPKFKRILALTEETLKKMDRV